jgi:hypothetical protein
MWIMRALSLAMLIGPLAGCVLDGDRDEGYRGERYRGEREGFYGEHRDRAFDRDRVYDDFHPEGRHGRDTLDRAD